MISLHSHYSIMPRPFMFLLSQNVPDWQPGEIAAAISGLAAGAIVSFLLYSFIRRVPWPRPFRFRYLLIHPVALVVFAVAWIGLSITFEALYTGSPATTRTAWRVVNLPSELPEISLLLYGVIVALAYSVEGRERAAERRTEAARAQLAALRAQLHPHFLFNALHTVVQLIPSDPDRAVEAAELVASLLRITIEENRDEVPLADEWNFVSRYLQVERLRFGDRLRVNAKVDPHLLDEHVPSFALQTLVENAIRHGAAHRVAPTDIVVSATTTDSKLHLTVWNEGNQWALATQNGSGTGLSRLRERLAFMYGKSAQLNYGPRSDGSYEAALVIPRKRS